MVSLWTERDVLDPYYLTEKSAEFWLASILFWGIGDTFTTIIGYLHIDGAVEANPVISTLLGIHGIGILFIIKIGFFGGFYAGYRMCPSPYRVGIPMGLTVVGVGVTVWNLVVFTKAI